MEAQRATDSIQQNVSDCDGNFCEKEVTIGQYIIDQNDYFRYVRNDPNFLKNLEDCFK